MGRWAANTDSNAAAAARGQIIQRILVDGWTTAQAAAAFGVGERDVARWVAAYRRHGMASLHDDVTTRRAPWRCLRRLLLALRRIRGAQGEAQAAAELAPFVLSRHHGVRSSRW